VKRVESRESERANEDRRSLARAGALKAAEAAKPGGRRYRQAGSRRLATRRRRRPA
jgi:hypothetical protein